MAVPKLKAATEGFTYTCKTFVLNEQEAIEINALYQQLSPGARRITWHDVNRNMQNNTFLRVSENASSRIIGIALLCTHHKLTGEVGFIEDVVVHQDFRKQGIGTDMIMALLGVGATKKLESITLTSRPKRIAVNKLYKQLGFKHIKTNVYRYTY